MERNSRLKEYNTGKGIREGEVNHHRTRQDDAGKEPGWILDVFEC